MENLSLHIEAVILASVEGINATDLLDVVQKSIAPDLTATGLEQILSDIQKKYEQESRVLQLMLINNSYQFLTKEAYHTTISALQSFREKKKLSQSALETLAIIAYRQPITKLEMEQIRGVNCDYSVQRLLEKGLVQIVGKADTIGKPLLYGTSDQFMHYFGINNLSDLPDLKDIEATGNSIGDFDDSESNQP